MTYLDKEICLLLEVELTVNPNGGEPVNFGVDDLVVFLGEMNCRWDVNKVVGSHYRFRDSI